MKGRHPIAIGLEAVTRAFLVSFFCGEKKEREVVKLELKIVENSISHKEYENVYMIEVKTNKVFQEVF